MRNAQLWREGTETNSESIKKEAKKLFVRKRFFSPILVRNQENEGPKIWSYGKMAYETLLGYVLDPDYGDITDPESGTDIVLNYSIPGTPGSFPKTALKPRRRPSVLCDDAVGDGEQCQALLDSIPDTESLFDRKTSKEIQEILDEYISGGQSQLSTSKETEKYNTVENVDRAFAELLNAREQSAV